MISGLLTITNGGNTVSFPLALASLNNLFLLKINQKARTYLDEVFGPHRILRASNKKAYFNKSLSYIDKALLMAQNELKTFTSCNHILTQNKIRFKYNIVE